MDQNIIHDLTDPSLQNDTVLNMCLTPKGNIVLPQKRTNIQISSHIYTILCERFNTILLIVFVRREVAEQTNPNLPSHMT